MATSRARALTVSNLENIMENKQQIVGKQFIQPAPRGTRGVLGDIINKTRSASIAADQPSKDLEMGKPKLRKVQGENKVEEKEMDIVKDEVEEMDVSGINIAFPEIEDIDKDDIGDPQLAVDYVQDIYKYLRFLEKEQSVKQDYLAGQKVILPKMRTVLVDWIVGVHLQFRLLPETLYTTVSILDRFLQNHLASINRATLQLVGVGAMLIASKYEEIFAPEIKDFVYITDNAYTERDIIRMELKILEGIEFNLGRPLPIHFLRRASKAGGVESITHTLAKYILELSLCDYSLAHELPSRIGASALALSIRLLDAGVESMEEVWTPVLVHYTTYTLPQLLPTIQKLATILAAAPAAKLSAVFQKYSNRKLMKISRIHSLDQPVLLEMAAGQF